jgi:cytochrome c oxidase subunit II
MSWRGGAPAPLACIILALGGCSGVQSSLDPAGPDASRIWLLGVVMVVGAAAILVAVCVALFLAIIGSDILRRRLASNGAIVAGGIVFPVVTLTILLICGLWVTRSTIAPAASPPQLQVDIVGEQWWWRIAYAPSSGPPVASANEIRIPVGRDVELRLTSADVIHSFWVPNIAGKLDMIPGRTTTLRLRADRTGRFRGQCAEYCGGAHALMALDIIVMPQSEFDAWLAGVATSGEPVDTVAQRGRAVFMAAGCGTCHAIRGTPANGRIGPDLSRIGERLSIAAHSLPNTPDAVARFIANSQHIKPGNRMPAFQFLKPDQIESLTRYLAGLR